MSLPIYIIVLFFIGLYLFSLCVPLLNSLLTSKHVYLGSLQGNHGYFFYIVIIKNNKQDKMKLENITIVFHSIMYYDPFDRLSHITQQ